VVAIVRIMPMMMGESCEVEERGWIEEKVVGDGE
jgi:hypothetical protein